MALGDGQGFLTQHQILQYSTEVQLLLQQRGSLLRPYCKTGRHRGIGASPVNQFGPVAAQKVQDRYGSIKFTEPLAQRRWVSPTPADLAIPVDNFDLLLTMENPISVLAENTAYAHGRLFDEYIITAAGGTSNIGTTGTGTETFDTSDYQVADNVGASSSTGLNVEKLIVAEQMLRKKDPELFDREKKVLVITRYQHSDLLGQAQVTSDEFTKNGGVLDNGVVKRFMGFDIKIVNDNLLTTTATVDRVCLAWVESGVYLGIWEDIQTRVTQRDDLTSQPWQIYTKSMAGATRLEQGKVVQILCNESDL